MCGVGGLTHDLRQGVTLQVQQDAPCLQAGPELKQAVEGQCGDVGLAPSFSSFLHFLLKLHPPTKMKENPLAPESSHPSVETYPHVFGLTWQTLSTLIHPPRAEACPFL